MDYASCLPQVLNEIKQLIDQLSFMSSSGHSVRLGKRRRAGKKPAPMAEDDDSGGLYTPPWIPCGSAWNWSDSTQTPHGSVQTFDQVFTRSTWICAKYLIFTQIPWNLAVRVREGLVQIHPDHSDGCIRFPIDSCHHHPPSTTSINPPPPFTTAHHTAHIKTRSACEKTRPRRRTLYARYFLFLFPF